MNWTTLLVVAAVIGVILLLKGWGQISAPQALAHLKNGAMVIDVRSAGEFSAGHLANAVNIPLEELAAVVPRRVRDKQQVLLLHCLSGTRSGLAKGKLKRLGYPNVFNLGSYRRAESILNSWQKNRI